MLRSPPNLLGAAALVGGACLAIGSGAAPADRPAGPNLVLVTIDTLRADRLGAYGYARATTPVLDRLAHEGVRFAQAEAAVPLTRPSHATLLTGRWPFDLGIRDNLSAPLAGDVPTLAGTLQARGYRTGAFIASFVLSRQSGLDRGFHHYDDRLEVAGRQFLSDIERPGADVVAAAEAWLGARPAEPFFLWLHLYEPHFPYEPPEPYRSRHAGRPYDGEVAAADALLGRLIETLERRGAAPRTLLAVTSDHGESLGQHGESAHGFFVYEATLRVPLILRQPGALPAARVVAAPIGGADLMPTLLELIGVAPLEPQRLRGISFAGATLGRGPAPQASIYSESLMPLLHFGWSELRALRRGPHKLILAPRPELYELRADPQEQTNLHAQRPEPARALRRELEALIAGDQPRRIEAAPVDPETLAKLAALGYTGGLPSGAIPSGPLTDPKDKITEFRRTSELIRSGILALGAGEHAAAERALRALLEAGNPSFEVHYYLGKALLAQEKFPASGEQLEAAIAILPHMIAPYLERAEAAARGGDLELGAATLERALRQDPNAWPAWARLARLRQRLGDPAAAETAWNRARELRPQDPELLSDLAAFYRDRGRPQEAIQSLEQALAAKPDDPELHNQLGMLLGGAGQMLEARARFQRAVELAPKKPSYRFNLAEIERRLGNRESAARGFRELLEFDASFAEARAKLAELEKGATEPGASAWRLRLIQVESLQAAETLRRRLQAGADFAELARRHSRHPSGARGGDLGTVPLSDLKPELRRAAERLAPGSTSAPIPSAGGYILLQRAPAPESNDSSP
ncbi:MAG TPA: sulfatase-like hydrolase/transferase [Acidobacteriota bacterium]